MKSIYLIHYMCTKRLAESKLNSEYFQCEKISMKII